MPPFRNRPSRRRERGLKARCLVTGFPASDIRHGDRRAVLVPYKRDRDEDGNVFKGGHHSKRYAVGMLLSVKEYVPGPTAFNVRLNFVHGPNGSGPGSDRPFTLKDVTREIARELGHYRLDAFWRHWIVNHDQAWYVRHLTEEGPASDKEIEERFGTRWKPVAVWLIRFDIETESAPRLLAESGGSDAFRPGPDGRWLYAPRDTDREEDRGYTSSDSRSLEDELPALTDEQWAKHVGPKSAYRGQDRLAVQRADRAASSVEQRYTTAKATARSKGYDIRDEVKRYDRHVQRGETEKALRQLERIETRVFPVAA